MIMLSSMMMSGLKFLKFMILSNGEPEAENSWDILVVVKVDESVSIRNACQVLFIKNIYLCVTE